MSKKPTTHGEPPPFVGMESQEFAEATAQSFLTIIGVLDFMSRSLPGMGGERMVQTIAELRNTWVPPADPEQAEAVAVAAKEAAEAAAAEEQAAAAEAAEPKGE